MFQQQASQTPIKTCRSLVDLQTALSEGVLDSEEYDQLYKLMASVAAPLQLDIYDNYTVQYRVGRWYNTLSRGSSPHELESYHGRAVN